MNDLIKDIDMIHTTEMGAGRIRKNLGLGAEDVVNFCKSRIEQADEITRGGKNWYVHTENIVITVNARSYTVITARKLK